MFFLIRIFLQEMGGYFIINGKEKIVRMLIMPRRNYVSPQGGVVCVCTAAIECGCSKLCHQPIAITRSSWKSRGPAYTEYGISISCARKDQTFSVSLSRVCCAVLWLWYQLFIQVFKFKVVSFFGKKKKDREKLKCNCRQGNNKGMRLYKSYVFVSLKCTKMVFVASYCIGSRTIL